MAGSQALCCNLYKLHCIALIKDFRCNPCPVSGTDKINFEYLLPTNTGTLYIYNTMGELITTTMLQPGINKTSINTADLPNGVYTYKVVYAEKFFKIGKFNIIH